MPSTDTVNSQNFRRILARNVTLPLGLGLVGAVLFVALIVYLLGTINRVEHSDLVLRKVQLLQRLSIDQETGMRGFLLTGSANYLEPYEAALPLTQTETAQLRLLVADQPQQIERLDRIERARGEWQRFAQELIALRRGGGDFMARVGSGRGKALFDQLRGQFDAFIDSEQRARFENNERANRNAILVIVGYVVTTLVISALLAFFGRRELLGLSQNYSGALAQQRLHAEGLQAQAWLREGQRQLAEKLTGKQELAALGHNALEFLARYLGSVVGALYVGGNGRLVRAASWGLPEDAKPAGQSFSGSDSVVAEAAANGRQIRLDQVPDGFLRVTSGLGHGAPQSVLVSPIENDGEVNGVVELGFLRPLQERDLELLLLARASLGAAVEAARYRQRLQDTLEETQQLNEELQAQQEELRTTNEELEEHSRALKESQAQLENQQAELEQTNLQLEQQRDSLDQKNDALNLTQQQLEHRATELERASRYKSEFLANMSHELRTPLNSSLILARLLADNSEANLTPEQVKFAESIHSAGNDLLNLINDILDIAKVEAGKLEVRPEPVALPHLAEGLRNLFEPLAERKGLRLEVLAGADLPPSLFTDRQRLEQILRNLLSNALKFTQHGAVTLTLVRSGPAAVAFEVRDSGIGIDPAQQEVIFEAFRQADGTTSRRFGGTGLGLSISRDLAGLLGGSISVNSFPGQGSTFTLLMPLQYEANATGVTAPQVAPAASRSQQAAPTPAPTQAPRPAAVAAFPDDRDGLTPGKRCVLVVEDDPAFARILFDLAHELGYDCLVAQQAFEGVALARQHIPDAALLDVRLPDDTGLSVLQQLKEAPATRHIPVHMMSAEDMGDTALQMGAIGHATKPASREQLREVFAKLEAKLTQKVKRVLLVEDDVRQREAVTHLIGDSDVEIVAVAQGQQALDALQGGVFDCMIIDLKLPDMSGQELLRRMAAGESRSFPPVIVYTGRNLTRDEEAELQRYSRSIIVKGARSPERLLDEVTLFLHRVETQLSGERRQMLRTARNRDKGFEGRRILVVDDDVRNIFALTSALEHKGALVEVARNGVEALAKLAATPDIDLVLMDLMMPEMDGYTAMREIRKNPCWQKLPIIAVTAKAMKDDQDRCLAAGANDYLAKPIELDRLFSLIRVWMPKVERV
jgi:CheY-like chemotaxis protein/signal transduction histidine kinase/CHASE3 domain sensor protein